MTDTKFDNNEPVAQHNSRANLESLLDEIIQQPERRAALQDATIQTREETVSISGLSLAYHVVQS